MREEKLLTIGLKAKPSLWFLIIPYPRSRVSMGIILYSSKFVKNGLNSLINERKLFKSVFMK